MQSHYIQKNPRVRKIRVRNSGAGNGCANFMDTWKNAFFLQENLHVRKIPRLGGGNFGFLGGGGSADFIFMGAGIFLKEMDTFRTLYGMHAFVDFDLMQSHYIILSTCLIVACFIRCAALRKVLQWGSPEPLHLSLGDRRAVS